MAKEKQQHQEQEQPQDQVVPAQHATVDAKEIYSFPNIDEHGVGHNVSFEASSLQEAEKKNAQYLKQLEEER
jgi:hypothetical protein